MRFLASSATDGTSQGNLPPMVSILMDGVKLILSHLKIGFGSTARFWSVDSFRQRQKDRDMVLRHLALTKYTSMGLVLGYTVRRLS